MHTPLLVAEVNKQSQSHRDQRTQVRCLPGRVPWVDTCLLRVLAHDGTASGSYSRCAKKVAGVRVHDRISQVHHTAHGQILAVEVRILDRLTPVVDMDLSLANSANGILHPPLDPFARLAASVDHGRPTVLLSAAVEGGLIHRDHDLVPYLAPAHPPPSLSRSNRSLSLSVNNGLSCGRCGPADGGANPRLWSSFGAYQSRRR